jgi:GGDEF domain-containing protein
MGELGFPELSTEQIELLCQTTEDAARKHIQTKVQSKNIERLDIAVEVEGTKPVNVTVEINLLLTKEAKGFDVEVLVKEAVEAAHRATENFLRKLK